MSFFSESILLDIIIHLSLSLSFSPSNTSSLDAASDAYACICLYRILEAKRKALTPTPPMPAYAELGLPILLVDNNDDEGNKLANPHAHNEEARIEKPSSKTK